MIESAPAGPNLDKYVQNMLQMCFQVPQSPQMFAQTSAKPYSGLPKSTPNRSKRHLRAHLGPMLQESSIPNLKKTAKRRPRDAPDLPKPFPNGAPNLSKSDFPAIFEPIFSHSNFEAIRSRFFVVFWMMFKSSKV